MHSWIEKYLVAFIVVDVLLIYASVSFVISRWSGWALLASRFRFDSKFTGTTWRWQSGQWRWLCGYNNALTIGVDPEGLYLATLPFFLLFHPRLFIPWNEITYARKSAWATDGVRYSLGRDLRIPLWLKKQTADRIKEAAGASYPIETLE